MKAIKRLTPMETIFKNYEKMEVEDFYEWMFENEDDLLKKEKLFLIDAFVTRKFPFTGKDAEMYFKEQAKIYNEYHTRDCITDKIKDLSIEQHEQIEKFIDAIIRQN